MLSPELFKKIKRIEIVSKHLVENVLSGDYLSTFHGQGLEFSEVREYQAGDDVRLIDWNVTARLQKPFVKVFQEERELTVVLAVDISGSSEFGSRGSSKRELAAQLAAALGFAAAGHGDRVGMLLFSDRVEYALPARRGRTHVLRGVRDLLSFRARGRGSDLGPALLRLPSLAKRKAVVFLISDFQVEDPWTPLKGAALRYDLVPCLVGDPAEERPPAGMGMVPCRDPETGRHYWLDTDSPGARRAWDAAARARREALASGFLKLKSDWFEVRTDQDFLGPLVRFFKARERRSQQGR